MEDMKKQAKLAVLKQIREMASQMMKDDMKANGLKKVTVASNTKEGLETGLDKAKDMLEKPDLAAALDKEDSSEDEVTEEEMEKGEEMAEDYESEEDLEEQIKALQEKKHKLMMK